MSPMMKSQMDETLENPMETGLKNVFFTDNCHYYSPGLLAKLWHRVPQIDLKMISVNIKAPTLPCLVQDECGNGLWGL